MPALSERPECCGVRMSMVGKTSAGTQLYRCPKCRKVLAPGGPGRGMNSRPPGTELPREKDQWEPGMPWPKVKLRLTDNDILGQRGSAY